MNHLSPSVFNLIWSIGVLSGLFGGAIAGLVQLLNGWRQRAVYDRQHLRDLALRIAIAEREQGSSDDSAFDHALIKKLKLVQLFAAKELTKAEFEKRWAEMNQFVARISKPPATDDPYT